MTGLASARSPYVAPVSEFTTPTDPRQLQLLGVGGRSGCCVRHPWFDGGGQGNRRPKMVTRSQIDRLGSRLNALSIRIGVKRVTYCVKLGWIQHDGSITDDDGKPWVSKPGTIVLGLEDPQSW